VTKFKEAKHIFQTAPIFVMHTMPAGYLNWSSQPSDRAKPTF